MEDHRKINPRIISAVDLTHLQPNERINLLGCENLKGRREFLEKLLKAGIVVGLPAIFLSGCEPEIKYIPTDEEDCPTYTPSGNNPLPCACNVDALAEVSPKVVNTIPAKNSIFTNESSGIEIRIDISKALDITSLTGGISISPEPVGGFDVHYYDLSRNAAGARTSLGFFKPGTSNKLVLLDDTSYTVTLKGTIKDINGKFLDGNNDGTGGDDFSFTFKTQKKYNSCICQSDCSCVGYSCSCQSYTCTCVGFYCSCIYAACPAHIK